MPSMPAIDSSSDLGDLLSMISGWRRDSCVTTETTGSSMFGYSRTVSRS